MNTRNMSFSQLLKKKGRSPQVEAARVRVKLIEIVEQWLEFPTADYTLYLDSMGYSQKALSSVGMFTSRNTAKPQQQMFDSWILKQSSISNKENINTMPKKGKVTDSGLKTDLPVKKRIGNEQKQTVKANPKVGVNNGRFSDMKSIQQSNKSMKYTTPVNIANSNSSETGFKSVGYKDYNLVRENDRNLTLQFQKIDEKPFVKPTQKSRCQEKNIFLACNATKIEEARSITYQKEIHQQQAHKKAVVVQEEEQKLSHYMSQMDDIMTKYANLSQSQQSVGELIIQNQTENCKYKQPLFTEDYSAKIQKQQQLQKIRIEQAKSNLAILLKDISNSSKVVNRNLPTFNHNFKKDEFQAPPVQEAANDSLGPQISVGYSFATNFLKEKQEEKETNNYLKIQHIEQVKSERSPFENSSDIKDYYERQFKNIAYNHADLNESHEDIQNIKSVRFEHEQAMRQEENTQSVTKISNEYENIYGPMDSFQCKYINVQDDAGAMDKNQTNNYAYMPPTQQKIQQESKLVLQGQRQMSNLQKISYGSSCYRDDQIIQSSIHDLKNDQKYQGYKYQEQEILPIDGSWKPYISIDQDQPFQPVNEREDTVRESLLIQNDSMGVFGQGQFNRQIDWEQNQNKSYKNQVQLGQKQITQSFSSQVSEECLITPQKQIDFQLQRNSSGQKYEQQEDGWLKAGKSVLESQAVFNQNYDILYPIKEAQPVSAQIQLPIEQTLPQKVASIDNNLTFGPLSKFKILNLSAEVDKTVQPLPLPHQSVQTIGSVHKQQKTVPSAEADHHIMNSPQYDIVVQKQQEHIVSILRLEEEQIRNKKNKFVTFAEPVPITSNSRQIKAESDQEQFAFDI